MPPAAVLAVATAAAHLVRRAPRRHLHGLRKHLVEGGGLLALIALLYAPLPPEAEPPEAAAAASEGDAAAAASANPVVHAAMLALGEVCCDSEATKTAVLSLVTADELLALHRRAPPPLRPLLCDLCFELACTHSFRRVLGRLPPAASLFEASAIRPLSAHTLALARRVRECWPLFPEPLEPSRTYAGMPVAAPPSAAAAEPPAESPAAAASSSATPPAITVVSPARGTPEPAGGGASDSSLVGSPLGSPGLRPAAAPSHLSPLLRTLSPQPPSFGGHSPPFAASLAPPFADLLPELASRGSSAAGSRYGYGFVSAGSANSAGWRTPRDDARGGTPQGGDFSSAIVSLELPGLARLRLRGAEAAGVLVRCVEQVGAPLEEQLALLLLLLLEANPCNKRAVQQWDGVAPFVRLAARCDATEAGAALRLHHLRLCASVAAYSLSDADALLLLRAARVAGTTGPPPPPPPRPPPPPVPLHTTRQTLTSTPTAAPTTRPPFARRSLRRSRRRRRNFGWRCKCSSSS